MSTKDCPSCGAVVPVAAARCKHCFHDFSEKPKKNSGPLVLLGFLALMAIIGSGTLWYVYTQRAQERIVVDEETQSIVITRKTASSTDTERVAFDRIEKHKVACAKQAAKPRRTFNAAKQRLGEFAATDPQTIDIKKAAREDVRRDACLSHARRVPLG